MSVDAPNFQPNVPTEKLHQQHQQQSASYLQNSEIMRHNIAQMYQYYNQLIMKQTHVPPRQVHLRGQENRYNGNNNWSRGTADLS